MLSTAQLRLFACLVAFFPFIHHLFAHHGFLTTCTVFNHVRCLHLCSTTPDPVLLTLTTLTFLTEYMDSLSAQTYCKDLRVSILSF